MNLVDSSGWLEYFSEGPNAEFFSSPLKDSTFLIVPVITTYEVFKVVLREAGENEALQAIAAMQKGQIKDLTLSIAMNAAKMSIRHSLPMADSIILATANTFKCTLWTQDSDFENLPGVNFISKKSASQPGH
ncbi:MAG: type II toxin-antitoxin system VapC family toxin [Desulfosarcinaceae bacterium]|jgi:predicted nucleic acid-binding protein